MFRKIKHIIEDYTNIIIILLLVTTFSGALRKWAGLPNSVNNIFLLILMLLPLYLVFFFKTSKTKPINSTILPIFRFFCIILAVLGLNPLNLTYFHGVFGFFMHLSFIAIILSYFKNRDTFNEKKIIKLFFIVLAIQLTIGTIQYNSPTDSPINRYADNRQNAPDEITDEEDFVQASATVGDAVRVTGTFSYLGGFTAILSFLLLFTFYLAKTKKSNYLLFLAPIVIYATLLSGSRSAVGFTLIILTAFVITEKKNLIKNPKPILASIAVIGLLLAINLSLGDKLGLTEKSTTAYNNFMSRVEANREESEGRLTNDLVEVFNRDFDYKYIGIGIGATYQGANQLFGTSNIVINTPLEGELFRIIVEGGIFFLIFRWLLLIVIFSHLNIPLFLKATLFLFMCVFSQNVFHIYNAIYFALGLIILNQAYCKKLCYNASSI